MLSILKALFESTATDSETDTILTQSDFVTVNKLDGDLKCLKIENRKLTTSSNKLTFQMQGVKRLTKKHIKSIKKLRSKRAKQIVKEGKDNLYRIMVHNSTKNVLGKPLVSLVP